MEIVGAAKDPSVCAWPATGAGTPFGVSYRTHWVPPGHLNPKNASLSVPVPAPVPVPDWTPKTRCNWQ